MDQRQLAEELREGAAWQYADGLMAAIGENVANKSEATDGELVKAASTCHTCNRSATNDDIEESIADAHSYSSFAKLIAPRIEHADDCIAEPDEEE